MKTRPSWYASATLVQAIKHTLYSYKEVII